MKEKPPGTVLELTAGNSRAGKTGWARYRAQAVCNGVGKSEILLICRCFCCKQGPTQPFIVKSHPLTARQKWFPVVSHGDQGAAAAHHW